jgi:thioredoxin-like negative regulator of GroEL
MSRSGVVGLLLLIGTASGLAAQQPGNASLARALELERQNQYGEAADSFRAVLAKTPGNAAALMGLERMLDALQRGKEIIPVAQAAAAVAPGDAVFGVLVRGWVAGGAQDSARAAVDRWAAASPGDVQPWRAWVQASMRQRDRATARAAVELARQALNDPGALAYEMAQLRAADGAWPDAAREWLSAITQLPGYQQAAAAALRPAPVAARPHVLAVLQQDSSLDAQLLAANLGAAWGDPEGAAKSLIAHLPPRSPRAIDALNAFAGQMHRQGGRGALMAQGMAQEEVARRTVGTPASRALVEAARAYQEAGDTDAARRVLALVASDGSSGTGAVTTLVNVLVAAGRMDEAEAKFSAAAQRLPGEERDQLRRALAWGWARAGNLARATTRLAGDSTVEGLALRGRIAIFQGDLANGAEMLRKAGPYAGSRDEATSRTALLALLQPIDRDSLPQLGAALLSLEQGDTASAVQGLERVAGALPAEAGGAGLHLLAGRLVHASGDTAKAEKMLRAANSPAAPAVAPVAELELARLMLASARRREAQGMLEHLILTYPASAVVPEARRVLDEVKGAVPPS